MYTPLTPILIYKSEVYGVNITRTCYHDELACTIMSDSTDWLTGVKKICRSFCWSKGSVEYLQSLIFLTNKFPTRQRGYKTFFMLDPAEHEINPAHKC